MATKEGTLAEIASADIVVFVSRSCPYCQTAMKDLEKAGFAASILDPSPSQRTVSEQHCPPLRLFVVSYRDEYLIMPDYQMSRS